MPFKKGQPGWNKGKHLTEEHKRKIGEAHKGKPGYNKGRKLSQETRKRMSESAKKRFANSPHPSKGRTISQEHKEILRRLNTGRKHSAERNKKVSDSLRARHKRIVGERRSAGLKRFYESNEVWNKGISHSEETRENISESMKEWWNERKQTEEER